MPENHVNSEVFANKLGGLGVSGMIGGVPVGMQMPGQGGMLALPSAQAGWLHCAPKRYHLWQQRCKTYQHLLCIIKVFLLKSKEQPFSSVLFPLHCSKITQAGSEVTNVLKIFPSVFLHLECQC